MMRCEITHHETTAMIRATLTGAPTIYGETARVAELSYKATGGDWVWIGARADLDYMPPVFFTPAECPEWLRTLAIAAAHRLPRVAALPTIADDDEHGTIAFDFAGGDA